MLFYAHWVLWLKKSLRCAPQCRRARSSSTLRRQVANASGSRWRPRRRPPRWAPKFSSKLWLKKKNRKNSFQFYLFSISFLSTLSLLYTISLYILILLFKVYLFRRYFVLVYCVSQVLCAELVDVDVEDDGPTLVVLVKGRQSSKS